MKVIRINPSLSNAEEQIKALVAQLVEESPEHLKKVGELLRSRAVFSFKRYMKKMGISLKGIDVPLFMDYLITKRIDLKDLEPEARKRLRENSLSHEPVTNKTSDYINFVDGKSPFGEPCQCKNCKWFREKPEGEDKDCVELGAKGIDKPCYGFILKIKM